MLPVNIAAIRNTPMGPEKPGPERPEAPVSGRRSFNPGVRMALPATFRRGGRVKRTGMAKVHKGEHVLPAASALGKGEDNKKAIKKIGKRSKAIFKQAKKAAKGKDA